MKRFFILTLVDLNSVGYRTSNVKLYDDLEKANDEMKRQYLEKCKENNIEEPFSEYYYSHEFEENDYAYIEGKYYWDIFNRDIEI